jgi:Protein of unknown function (DUF742)
MTTPDDQPMAPGRRRVRPYAMTGGRTRPTHDDLEIEALVSTTSIGEQTAKLTVEQRAIAALCHDILSIAEVSAQLHLPPGRHPGPGWRHGRPEPGHRPPARPSWRPSRPGPAGAGAVRAAHHLTATCSSQPRIGDASKAAVAADTAGACAVAGCLPSGGARPSRCLEAAAPSAPPNRAPAASSAKWRGTKRSSPMCDQTSSPDFSCRSVGTRSPMPTATSVAWCSASDWSAPDRSALLTLGASSVASDAEGTRWIVWMIKSRGDEPSVPRDQATTAGVEHQTFHLVLCPDCVAPTLSWVFRFVRVRQNPAGGVSRPGSAASSGMRSSCGEARAWRPGRWLAR